MFNISFPTSFPNELSESIPAAEIPAIQHCLTVWRDVYKTRIAKNKSRLDSADEAGDAYRNAMPPLIGIDSIRDFIACAAHGLLIGAIQNQDATKLLYAAQVALSICRQESASAKSSALPPPATEN